MDAAGRSCVVSMKNDTGARLQRLVEELKRRGCIRTAGVEAAFRAIPRRLFVPGVPLDDVYADKAIPTKRAADGGFISSSSQPAIMALMLEQLALVPGHRVLEIGAGTGYNAALMSHIVGPSGQVVTMDIDEDLVAGARDHLAAAGFDRVRVICGDGGLGHPEAAPYDRIILTVGAWDITPAWREQLMSGGRLLLPLSIKGPQMCVAFERANEHLESVSIEECGFMPLRGAFAGPARSVQIEEISMAVADPGGIDPIAIGEWLKGRARDQATGIRIRPMEAFGPLSQWLAFRQTGYCFLSATGDAADRGIIPDLFRWSEISTARQAHTFGVVSERGLCVLMRAEPPSSTKPEVWPMAYRQRDERATTFEVLLRTYGSDDKLAHRVMEHIKSWDAADRPSRKGLRIRAYAKEAGYRPTNGELVVDKRWSRLVLDWPRGG